MAMHPGTGVKSKSSNSKKAEIAKKKAGTQALPSASKVVSKNKNASKTK